MVAVLAVGSVELRAQPPGGTVQPGATAQEPAPGDVDLRVSRVFIFVPKAGIGHDHAIEGKLKSGRLTLDATQDAGELVFDMPTFDADTAAARRHIGLGGGIDAGTRREVNSNMLGPDVLNVRRFPTATFAVTSVLPTKQPARRGTAYQLTGKFTLHGTSRALTVMAEAEESEGRIHLRGSFPLVQTNYGIQPFTKAFGAVGVANQLTAHADLWIAAGKPAAKNSAP